MAEGFVEDKAPRPQHSQEYLNGVWRCGEQRDHKVRIHRAKWPPQPNPSLNDRPFVEGVCERCGGHVQIYDPPDRSITVVLYGEAGEQQGRVEDEVGDVVAEETLPATGQVVTEEPMGRRGRR